MKRSFFVFVVAVAAAVLSVSCEKNDSQPYIPTISLSLDEIKVYPDDFHPGEIWLKSSGSLYYLEPIVRAPVVNGEISLKFPDSVPYDLLGNANIWFPGVDSGILICIVGFMGTVRPMLYQENNHKGYELIYMNDAGDQALCFLYSTADFSINNDTYPLHFKKGWNNFVSIVINQWSIAYVSTFRTDFRDWKWRIGHVLVAE